MKRIATVIMLLVALSNQISVFSQDNKNRKESAEMEEQITPKMYVADNRLYVNNASVGKRVEVFSIIGNKIREIPITASDNSYELNLPRAIYIFRLDGEVKKFVIK
ncbi:MAG: T9SS type A sorting domain-containing protein [Tannerella sp.]|jgi:hypothetical protein|nr:T9SS type A sorting domain-containing protein [Tannerella sp.]